MSSKDPERALKRRMFDVIPSFSTVRVRLEVPPESEILFCPERS